MDKQMQDEIARFQDSLPALRKATGLSAEMLGAELDVTRQTIVNLETGQTKMTKIQYIAIRSVLESKANAKENDMLPTLMATLVDQQLDDKTRNELKTVIDNAASKVGRRSGAAAIGAAVAAAAGAFLAGPLGIAAAGTAAALGSANRNHKKQK